MTLAGWLDTLTPYILGVLGGVIIGIPIGRIQGAERVQRGCAGPGAEITGVQCARCLLAVQNCRCPMAQRRGRA